MERVFVAWLLTCAAGFPLLGALSVYFSAPIEVTSTVFLLGLSVSVVVVQLVPRLHRGFISATSVCVVAVLILLCCAHLLGFEDWSARSALAVLVASIVSVRGYQWALPRLPLGLDGMLRSRRSLAILWSLLALAALVQCVRLGTFMADPTFERASVYPIDQNTVRHQALAAYVYGAELDRRGVHNIYDPALYPDPGEPGSPPPTEVLNLGPYIEEPFQYPPPFLLLPRLALTVSNDFRVIRAITHLLNVWLFLLAALVACRWVGGERGVLAGLLIPVVWLGLPTLFTFQFGQFHLAAVCLTVLGMVAVEQDRPAAGGTLIGLAVAGKLFPAILLVYLAFQRRWRPIGWSLVTILVLCGLTLAVSGPDAFAAFFSDQLPRLSTGSNVPFDAEGAFSAYNASFFGFVHRLYQLGVAGLERSHGAIVAWGFSILLLAAAAYAGRRAADRPREVAQWLALSSLAALRTPLAPTSYVPASALWLLVWVVVMRRGKTESWAWILLAWVFLNPLPELADQTLHVAITTLCPLTIIGLSAWALLRRPG